MRRGGVGWGGVERWLGVGRYGSGGDGQGTRVGSDKVVEVVYGGAGDRVAS